jgi:hypothetical protein
VPVPLGLDYSETSDYAPGGTTKQYHDDSPEVKRVKDGHALGKSLGILNLFIHADVQAANQQIDAMHTIAHDHEKPEHKAILNEHFGEHHNIDAIKQHVATLKTGEVKIGAIKDTAMGSQYAKTKWGPGTTNPKVHFGGLSHTAGRTAQDTAGTLVHEASHALWQSKDHYARPKKDAPLAPVSKQDYQKLQAKIPVTKHDERLVTGCKFCILQDIISS